MDDQVGQEFLEKHLLELIDRSCGTPWIFVNDLKEGDVLSVLTENTRYNLLIKDPETGFAIATSNGKHIAQEVKCFIAGTKLSTMGTSIKALGLTTGLRLVLTLPKKGELVLSSTQEISINGQVVLSEKQKKSSDMH
jgi:hypothetical protein